MHCAQAANSPQRLLGRSHELEDAPALSLWKLGLSIMM